MAEAATQSSFQKYQEIWRNRSPKSRSVLSMALASAMHFAGYEYARTGTLTLITSERAGFSSASIVPLAMGFVSPISLLLLWVSSSIIRLRNRRLECDFGVEVFPFFASFLNCSC